MKNLEAIQDILTTPINDRNPQWTQSILLNHLPEINKQLKSLEDSVWALNDSLNKISKHDPMAITDHDLNRMHTAQALLKKSGLME